MFKYKTDEEISAMTADERNRYAADKRAHEAELTSKAVKEATDPLTKKLEDQEETLKGLKTEVKEAKENAAKAIEVHGSIKLETVEQAVTKFISENFDTIKSLRSKGHGVVEFQIKVVDEMTAGNAVVTSAGIVGTAGSATNPDGIAALIGVQVAPPKKVNLRNTIVNELVTRFQTGLAAYPYTESVPKDGDFGFIAEGADKSQLDFKIETRYAQPVKAAGWVHLTEESIQDIPGLQSIALGYLRDKHDIRKQRGILFGDGVSPNPKGATEYGRAFVVGSMANAVQFPNFMDVVNAAIADVYTTHNYQDEMPYMPSLVLINPIDFFVNLQSAKDERGLPLYPQASLFNKVEIGGVTIMPEEMIPTGKIFVADMSKYNVSDYVGYTVKIGWINDDFIKNQFVILGESRFHAFVRKLDQQAFIYDDFATIKTAISATI